MSVYEDYSQAFNGESGSEWQVAGNYPEREYLTSDLASEFPIFVRLAGTARSFSIRDAAAMGRALLREAEFYTVMEAIKRNVPEL